MRDKVIAKTKLQAGQGKLRKREASESSCQGLTELVQVSSNESAVFNWLKAALVARSLSRGGHNAVLKLVKQQVK